MATAIGGQTELQLNKTGENIARLRHGATVRIAERIAVGLRAAVFGRPP